MLLLFEVAQYSVSWLLTLLVTFLPKNTKNVFTCVKVIANQRWDVFETYSVQAQETAKHCGKFGWPPLSDVGAVTKPRRETRWNLLGCPILAYRCQPLVGRSSPYCEDMWRRYCCLTRCISKTVHDRRIVCVKGNRKSYAFSDLNHPQITHTFYGRPM